MDIHDLFEKLDRPAIDRLIEDKQQEDLHWEFKAVSSPNLREQDEKKNFAKALSGFANSDGGLLIWGIDCRKKDGVEQADASKPISQLSLFVSRLRELTGQFVSPTVEGVQHKEISFGDDHGYAVTLVPPSDSGPHMARGGEDRYYKRSGSSFYRMEHFDIEDMFGRRKKSKLSLSVQIVNARAGQNRERRFYECRIILGIRNDGRGTAKYPSLSVQVRLPHKISEYGVDGNGNFGIPLVRDPTRRRFERYGAGPEVVIHPGAIHPVTGINFHAYENEQGFQDVSIAWEISAEDMRAATGETVVSLEDIAAAASRTQP